MAEKKEGKINNLLKNIDFKVEESKNFPTRVIRTIIQHLNIGITQWSMLVNEWANCPYTGIRNSLVERTNARGNMVKEVTSDEATWNAVMKFLKVIRCVKFRVRFELHFSWRRPAVVEFETQNLPLPSLGEKLVHQFRTSPYPPATEVTRDVTSVDNRPRIPVRFIEEDPPGLQERLKKEEKNRFKNYGKILEVDASRYERELMQKAVEVHEAKAKEEKEKQKKLEEESKE